MTRRAVLSSIVGARLSAQIPGLRLVSKLVLSNAESRLGQPGYDVAGKRIFVPAANGILVADTRTGKLLEPIAAVKMPQSVLHVAEKNRLVITGREEGVKILDGVSRAQVSLLKATRADRLRYQPATKAILAGHAGGVLVMDLNGTLRGEVRLDAQPDAIAVESSGRRFFIADAVRKSIVVADSSNATVIATWPVQAPSALYGIEYDDANRRIFLSGRRPNRMMTLDGFSGVLIDQRDTVTDPSFIAYDRSATRIYIVGNGEIDVVQQASKDYYMPHSRIPIRPGARSALFVPEEGWLIVPVPKTPAERAAVLIFEAVK